MTRYHPGLAPNPTDWLKLDEEERVNCVAAYHRRKRIALPKPTLHAALHVTIETQIAMKDEVVCETMARLREEGLTRHGAIHAVGSVLLAHLQAIAKSEQRPPPTSAYYDRLRLLTASDWLQSHIEER